MEGRRGFLAGVGAAVAGLFGWLKPVKGAASPSDPFEAFSAESGKRKLRVKLYRRTYEDGKRFFLEIPLEEAKPGDRCILIGLNALCLFQAVVFTYQSHRFDAEGQLYVDWRDVFPLFDAPEGKDYSEVAKVLIAQRRAKTSKTAESG